MDALASAGPAKLPKACDGQFAELEKELALGPADHGWEDQRWTLPRVRALIAWKFGIDCSSVAVWRLLHRHGWSWPSPARRALERRRAGCGLVEEGRVAAGGMTAAALGAYIVFEDRPGSR
ncbi:winged helix-turn-helix domain-containing protein [Streptomyces sp. NPDC048419]|uniref:helix-turn-helix domain-containing protein n=1 Tax=Streptomyces sp. NPDC048419 TaxID=3365547 RepID=UPI00371B52BA